MSIGILMWLSTELLRLHHVDQGRFELEGTIPQVEFWSHRNIVY